MLPPLVRREVVRAVEVHRVDALERHELADLDRARSGLLERLQLLGREDHILVFCKLVTLHDLLAGNDDFLPRAHVLLPKPRAAGRLVQQVERERARGLDGGIDLHRNRDHPERHRDRSDGTGSHGESSLGTARRPHLTACRKPRSALCVTAPTRRRPDRALRVKFAGALARFAERSVTRGSSRRARHSPSPAARRCPGDVEAVRRSGSVRYRLLPGLVPVCPAGPEVPAIAAASACISDIERRPSYSSEPPR